MPRIPRRLGRLPGLVALAAVLAMTVAWTPSSHWRAAVPGERTVAHPAGAVEALTAAVAAGGAAGRIAAAPAGALVDAGSRRVPAAAARPRAVEAPKPTPKPTSKPAAPKYTGRNHLWIPALGVSQSIVWFPCSRTRPPGPYTYRWGCAGKNNVYILGHASGVMKPLHDAYVAGRLRVGMVAYYANGNGVVTKYAVKFWRLTLPVGTTQWWIAPQPVPSLTLQTCYGRNSEWRLKVRLVAVR